MKTPSPTIGRTLPEQNAPAACGARLRAAAAPPSHAVMPVACLTPLADSAFSRTVYVLGRAATFGRGEAADWVFADAAMSRIHCELSRAAEGWELVDKGSMNGTEVDGVRIAPHAPVRLHARARIRFASARFEFHCREDGDALFACLAEAEHPGLYRREVLLEHMQRKMRQGHGLFLLAVDVDDYSSFLRCDRSRAYDAFGRLVRALSEHAACDGEHPAWGPFRVGDNTIVLCLEGHDYESSANRAKAIHDAVSSAVRTDYPVTVSAALVRAEAGSPTPATLAALDHKLTHARLLGPGTASLGAGSVTIYRATLDALAAGSHRFATAIRVRAPEGAPVVERAATVRRWLSAAAAALSRTEDVAFGWTTEGHVGALLTGATLTQVGTLAVACAPARFEARSVDGGFLDWVREWDRADDAQRDATTEPTFLLAHMLADYESSSEAERRSHMPAQLEAAMRFLACTLVSAEMYRAFRDDDRASLDALAHLLARTLGGAVGPGTWLRLIEEVASGRGTMMARTPVAALLGRKDWSRKARAGAEARNDSVHDMNPEERRQRLFGKMRAAILATAGLFDDGSTTLYALREVRQSQKVPGRYRADGVRLTGLAPGYGPIELDAPYLCPGVWVDARHGDTRDVLLLSPFVQYQKCPECGRPDLFTLGDFDRGTGELMLAGSLHHHALQCTPPAADEFACEAISALRARLRPGGREGFTTMTELPAYRP